MTALEIVNN